MSNEGIWPGSAGDPWRQDPVPEGRGTSWGSISGSREQAERSAAAARAVAARPKVPAGPRWLPVAAALAGLVGAVAVPGAPPGLGVVVTTVAVSCCLLPLLLRRGVSGWSLAAGSCALLLAGMSGVLDADWLVAADLMAAFAVGSIVLAGGASFRDLARGAASVVLASPMVSAHLSQPAAARIRARKVGRWGATARAIALSLLLVAVFGALFSSAAAALGRLLGHLVPSLSLDLLPVRIAFFALVVGLVGAGALVAGRIAPVGLSRGLHDLADLLLAPFDPELAPARPSRLEWLLPLAVLDVLFGAFVAVQFAVFFGGNHHLAVTPGLTAAEYARTGFFQLLAVCILTLGVVAAAIRWVDRAERTRLRSTLGPLVVLTAIVLLSAAQRLANYEEAFGYTRLRLVVAASMAVIAAVLALLLIAGALWRARWLPRGVLAAGVFALLALNLINADGFIARRNIDRAGAAGSVDTAYLSGLSADAVPALLRLPEPARSCVLIALRARLDRADEGGWRGANFARARARALIAATTIVVCPNPVVSSRE
ncbi:MAG: DUF4173 domain-containing protein [Actinomycetota bacterium]